jgi:hypothetical protein
MFHVKQAHLANPASGAIAVTSPHDAPMRRDAARLSPAVLAPTTRTGELRGYPRTSLPGRILSPHTTTRDRGGREAQAPIAPRSQSVVPHRNSRPGNPAGARRTCSSSFPGRKRLSHSTTRDRRTEGASTRLAPRSQTVVSHHNSRPANPGVCAQLTRRGVRAQLVPRSQTVVSHHNSRPGKCSASAPGHAFSPPQPRNRPAAEEEPRKQ